MTDSQLEGLAQFYQYILYVLVRQLLQALASSKASNLKICISLNTKCHNLVGFPKSGHKWSLYMHTNACKVQLHVFVTYYRKFMHVCLPDCVHTKSAQAIQLYVCIHTYIQCLLYHILIFNALGELLCQVALLVTNPTNSKEFPCNDSGHFQALIL